GTGDGTRDDPAALELIRGRHAELLEADQAPSDVVDLLPGGDVRASGRVGAHLAHFDAEPVLGDAGLALLAGIVDRPLGKFAHPQTEGVRPGAGVGQEVVDAALRVDGLVAARGQVDQADLGGVALGQELHQPVGGVPHGRVAGDVAV